MPISVFSIKKMVGQSSWGYQVTHQTTLRSEWTTAVLQHPPLLPMMSTCSEWRGQLLSLMLTAQKFTLKFARNDLTGYDGSPVEVRLEARSSWHVLEKPALLSQFLFRELIWTWVYLVKALYQWLIINQFVTEDNNDGLLACIHPIIAFSVCTVCVQSMQSANIWAWA